VEGKREITAFFAHVTYGIIVICAPKMLAGAEASADVIAAGQRKAYHRKKTYS